jgi:outer membrane protein assembly factor BamE (lipoprotein component of BamABCDE complex)
MKRLFIRYKALLGILFLCLSLFSVNVFAETPECSTVQKVKHPIRILAIGNSFSQDAVEQYLYELAAAEDIPVVIGNLYIGGCTLAKHLKNANKDLPHYEYRKIINGVKTEKNSVKLSDALKDENWDYISMQQASGVSGIYKTYEESLPQLVAYVKAHATNKHVKLMLHQTWAYAANSDHGEFPNYNCNQMTMYKALVDSYNKAAKLVKIKIIIPSGTAIQNGRTSSLGDTFNRDGYHLELTYGRYTAACTWFEKIFKKNVIGNTFAPAGVSDKVKSIAQRAAHAAVLRPSEVTPL